MGMKGFKGFEKDFSCGGKQCEENTTYEEYGEGCCYKGVMHFYEDPWEVLNHYDLVDGNGNLSEFAEVEALGQVWNDGEKRATNKIHVGAKLGLKGFLKACIDFTLEKTNGTNLSGNSAQIGSSGDSAQIGSSSNYAKISLSGTSTTTSSNKEPKNTGILAAWVAANTASPHTLPVVPPQNRTFNGVEIATATKPATQAVMIAFGKDFIKPRRAMIPAAAPIPRLVSA